MENLLDEFNEIENDNNKQNNIDNLLNKAEKLIEVNEKLIKDSEKRKIAQTKKETIQEQISQLTDEQYNQLIDYIEKWGYETAFKLSGGLPAITIKTTTLAELFKTIYIAGMKGN